MLILPKSEFNFYIKFDEYNIVNFDDFLNNFDKNEIQNMKNECINFYKKYILEDNFVEIIYNIIKKI